MRKEKPFPGQAPVFFTEATKQPIVISPTGSTGDKKIYPGSRHNIPIAIPEGEDRGAWLEGPGRARNNNMIVMAALQAGIFYPASPAPEGLPHGLDKRKY